MIERYQIVDDIGTSRSASLYLARLKGLGGFQKWVTIKRLHPHLAEDGEAVDMFLNEARITASINHANVARVFEVGEDDNTYWIAMEYLQGATLLKVMRRAKERGIRITPTLAAWICADAAEGLHAAHTLRGTNGQLLSVVHRDVKPNNIFLTYDGQTKLFDFGDAKVADRPSPIRTVLRKGMFAYMAPEQVCGVEADCTTDIFALGIVLWELTTNHRLFQACTDFDAFMKARDCLVPPPSSVVADYPIELEGIVMKALAKRSHDRFQSARELAIALRHFHAHNTASVEPEDVALFVRQAFPERVQR